MAVPLRILILEDDPIDADIVKWALKESLNCIFHIAVNKEAYALALDEFQPDVILADNALPRFSAKEALEMLLHRAMDIPFILVTGTVSEEFAASIIRMGADDYILKDRLGRLPAAIDTALNRKIAEAALKQGEEIRRLIMNAALDAIICVDSSGLIKLWNSQAENMFGWQENEITGKQLTETIIPLQYRGAYERDFKDYLQTGKGDVFNKLVEITALHRSGKIFPIEFAIVPMKGGADFFCAFIRDITLRKKREEKLRRSYEEIRRLASHLQDVREEERLNMSREIHDELGQQLTVIKMDIGWLKRKLALTESEPVREKLEELNLMADETIKTVRRIAADLRPGLLDELGLGAAIEWHLKEFQKRTGIKVQYNAVSEELPLSGASKTGLFRIVQESLTNVVRYAQAKNVEVRMEKDDDGLLLFIQDDGIGFDQEKIAGKKTFGFVGMRERTAMMGGSCNISSMPGKGTTITIQVPLVGKFIDNV
jgi:two-component system sensor histidine kinase UhpB